MVRLDIRHVLGKRSNAVKFELDARPIIIINPSFARSLLQDE
jgi:hypothetical protein